MVLYALLVSLFFTLLWRRGRREQVKLFLQLFLGMVGGGLLVAWLMFPFPSGPASSDSMRPAVAKPGRSSWSSPARPRRPPRRPAGVRAAPAGPGPRDFRPRRRRAAGRRVSSPWPTAREVSVVGITEVLQRSCRASRQVFAALLARGRPPAARRRGADRLPGLQSAPRPRAGAARRAGGLLHQPAGLGLAPGPGPHHRAAGRPHAGAVPVRGRVLPPRTSVEVVHVGHPLVDEVPELCRAPGTRRRRRTRTVPASPCCRARGAARSRPCCPTMLEAVRRLAARAAGRGHASSRRRRCRGELLDGAGRARPGCR